MEVASDHEQAPLRCFFISPIGEMNSPERHASDLVLRYLVQNALDPGYSVARADESSNPGLITPEIIASIAQADLIVADMTGFNPSVFYEIAVAHGYRKPTVHIQIDSEPSAFDVRDMRTVRYTTSDPEKLEAAKKQLREFADFAVTRTNELRTPISDARQFVAEQTSDDPATSSYARLYGELLAIQRLLSAAIEQGDSSERSKAIYDIRPMATIINRIVRDGRATVDDFAEVISSQTTPAFDRWVKRRAASVSDPVDHRDLEALLRDRSMPGYDDDKGKPVRRFEDFPGSLP